MDTRTCHACFSVSPSVFHHLSYHQVLLTPDSVDCSVSLQEFSSIIELNSCRAANVLEML